MRIGVPLTVAAALGGFIGCQFTPDQRLERTARHYAADHLDTTGLHVIGNYQGGECHVVEVQSSSDHVVHSVIFVSPDLARPVYMSATFSRSVFVPDSDDLCGLTSSGIVTSDVTAKQTQHGPQ